MTVTDIVQHELEKLERLLNAKVIAPECFNLRRSKVIDEALKPEPSDDVTTVYVGHVHRSLEKEILYPTFSKFGEIRKIEMLPSASKKPRKEWWAVFVEFETHEAAAQAIFHLNNEIPAEWPEQTKPLFMKWAGTKEQTDEYQRQQQEKQQQMAALLAPPLLPLYTGNFYYPKKHSPPGASRAVSSNGAHPRYTA